MPPTRRGRRKLDRDGGAVTVEAAIALAGFVAVLTLALGAISAAIDQLRCIDAAREAARLVARGEPDRARAVAEEIAPGNAAIAITVEDDTIQVDVRAAPVNGLLPGLDLHAEAYAIAEPAATEANP
ncbi:MAG: pilus assembly protein [Actinophytocola sp.]|uniref:TadE family type IV pilus minor pilin n=1 Tax=Actinophytocola sp. TaxID=1872138 RepID=UPI0013236F81|nr:TadE family type IV pilus minor pilin [Actinophytocola sp.]MPZ82058.1 pilus assembly protein [Actinophytocola sp.]